MKTRRRFVACLALSLYSPYISCHTHHCSERKEWREVKREDKDKNKEKRRGEEKKTKEKQITRTKREGELGEEMRRRGNEQRREGSGGCEEQERR